MRSMRNRRDPEDDNLFVSFFNKPVEDKQATIAAGRPIHKPVVYVSIRAPHMQDETIRKASQLDRQRFPEQWDHFLTQNNTESKAGTLISECSFFSSITRADLGAIGITTVDELAQLSPSEVKDKRLAEAYEKAQSYLAMASGTGKKVNQLASCRQKLRREKDKTAKLMDEVATLRAENETMKRLINVASDDDTAGNG